MTREDRDTLAELLPVSWIDPDIVNRLVAEIAVEAGREAGPFMFDVASVGVERTLTTVWRMLLRFTSDHALVSRTPILYKKTYDAGSMTSHIERRGEAHIRLDGWPGVARLDLIGLQGGIEATLRCAGRRNAEVRFQRTATGALFTATWDP
jgi:hypothetical protein